MNHKPGLYITGSGQRYVPVIAPQKLKYEDIDPDWLVGWLKKKKSALASLQFVQACIKAGKKYDVNPLLLVAVTGQEQSFCPLGSSIAMLNNPWNVFGNWQNTDLSVEKSAMYAAECIARLSSHRPANIHPVAWLNSQQNPSGMYATDPLWWMGVSYFFQQLLSDFGYSPQVNTEDYVYPIQQGAWYISSPFGEIRDTGPHRGVDFACPAGTPIYAVVAGVITELIKGDPVGGNQIWMSGKDGRIYTFWHCSRFADISVGQVVEAGAVIGYVGSTGKSTGPHLHFGVMEKNRWIDGLELLKQE